MWNKGVREVGYNRILMNTESNIKPWKRLTFPKASNPLSKKRITPKNVKNKPKPISPSPTSAFIKDTVINLFLFFSLNKTVINFFT